MRSLVPTATLRITLLAAILIAMGGCASQPPPPPPPPPAPITSARLYSGTPLSGPLTNPIKETFASDALSVKVTFIRLNSMPENVLQPIGAQSALVVTSRGGTPVPSYSQLARGARAGSVADASSFVASLGSAAAPGMPPIELRGALPNSATLTFRFADPAELKDPATGQTTHRLVEVDLCRVSGADPAKPDQTLQVGLAVQSMVSLGTPGVESEEHPEALAGRESTVLQRELAIFNRPLTGGKDLSAVITPFAFDPTSAVAALIEVRPGSSDPFTELVYTDNVIRANRAATQASKRLQDTQGVDSESAGLRAALESLSRPGSPRAALVYLADQAAAPTCGDMALLADEPVLARLAAAVHTKADSAGAVEKQSLGWILEQSAYELMTQLSADGKLPPELSSVLTLHAGEAGRHADALSEALHGASSTPELVSRIVTQNYIFLEDSSPAARVRAFDWLGTIGRAPAGYDPLSSARQRRAALEKALTASAGVNTK